MTANVKTALMITHVFVMPVTSRDQSLLKVTKIFALISTSVIVTKPYAEFTPVSTTKADTAADAKTGSFTKQMLPPNVLK